MCPMQFSGLIPIHSSKKVVPFANGPTQHGNTLIIEIHLAMAVMKILVYKENSTHLVMQVQ